MPPPYFAENGGDQPVDLDVASSWYRRAGEAGDARACDLEADCVRRAGGSRAEVRSWCRRAAEGGDSSGAYRYAWALEKGYGGPEDPEGARTWYRRAAALGSKEAAERLQALGAAPR